MSEFGFSEYSEYSEGSDTTLPEQTKKPPISLQQQELIDARGWGDTKRVNELLARGVIFPEVNLSSREQQSTTGHFIVSQSVEILSAPERQKIDDAAWSSVRPE